MRATAASGGHMENCISMKFKEGFPGWSCAGPLLACAWGNWENGDPETRIRVSGLEGPRRAGLRSYR